LEAGPLEPVLADPQVTDVLADAGSGVLSIAATA
jgi:hypothetical protein